MKKKIGNVSKSAQKLWVPTPIATLCKNENVKNKISPPNSIVETLRRGETDPPDTAADEDEDEDPWTTEDELIIELLPPVTKNNGKKYTEVTHTHGMVWWLWAMYGHLSTGHTTPSFQGNI